MLLIDIDRNLEIRIPTFFPLQYCEYYPAYDKCKQWLEKNIPEMFQELMAGGKIMNSSLIYSCLKMIGLYNVLHIYCHRIKIINKLCILKS